MEVQKSKKYDDTYFLLLRFRDKNMFCFDVMTRYRNPIDNGGFELIIGQIFYNSSTDAGIIRGNCESCPITDDETSKYLAKKAKEIVLDYEKIRNNQL